MLAGASFIPLLGVPVGLAAILVGLASRRPGGRRVAWIGAAGIAFSVLLYGGLFYFGFVQRGGVYDHLRARLAQAELNDLVPRIEFYRLQHGRYPEDLDALRGEGGGLNPVMIMDPSTVSPRAFFYRRVGDRHYYLRGLGPDGEPFTADDLVPTLAPTSGSNIGLLLDPPRPR
ncbi:hypothetical protein [Dyella lutea]|uniref:Type II secretion system protein GspG C-terminal domain-containing protein n=1 Tax=Dyella lutea TaxID=2950441 RepID=A0ABT1FEN7_9GAMM|nr:hypothetical protein [Dyella lutea]